MSSILTLRVFRGITLNTARLVKAALTARFMQRLCKELLICAKLAVLQQPGTTASNILQLKIAMYVEERMYGHDLVSYNGHMSRRMRVIIHNTNMPARAKFASGP